MSCEVKFKTAKEGTSRIYDELRQQEEALTTSERCCYRVGNRCIQPAFPTFKQYCDENIEKQCPYYTRAKQAGLDNFRRKLVYGY